MEHLKYCDADCSRSVGAGLLQGGPRLLDLFHGVIHIVLGPALKGRASGVQTLIGLGNRPLRLLHNPVGIGHRTGH